MTPYVFNGLLNNAHILARKMTALGVKEHQLEQDIHKYLKSNGIVPRTDTAKSEVRALVIESNVKVFFNQCKGHVVRI